MNTNPPDIKAAFSNPAHDLASLVQNHNLPRTPSYLETIPATSGDAKAAVFRKIATHATFLAVEKEAYIPVSNFELDEIKTILRMFAHSNIRSEFIRGGDSHLYLTVTDKNNQHFVTAGRPTPFSMMHDEHQRLNAQIAVNAFLAADTKPAALPPSLYPQIEICTAGNQLYIPLGRMSEHQKAQLDSCFRVKGIGFEKHPSPLDREIFVFPIQEYETFEQVKSNLENVKNEIEAQALKVPAFQIPAIQMLDDQKGSYYIKIGSKALPEERERQKEHLESRFNRKGLKFERYISSTQGEVYRFPKESEHILYAIEDDLMKDSVKAELTSFPQFEILNAQRKGLYIPIQNMNVLQEEQLKSLLLKYNIPHRAHISGAVMNEGTGERLGLVFQVPTKYEDQLNQLQQLIQNQTPTVKQAPSAPTAVEHVDFINDPVGNKALNEYLQPCRDQLAKILSPSSP